MRKVVGAPASYQASFFFLADFLEISIQYIRKRGLLAFYRYDLDCKRIHIEGFTDGNVKTINKCTRSYAS